MLEKTISGYYLFAPVCGNNVCCPYISRPSPSTIPLWKNARPWKELAEQIRLRLVLSRAEAGRTEEARLRVICRAGSPLADVSPDSLEPRFLTVSRLPTIRPESRNPVYCTPKCGVPHGYSCPFGRRFLELTRADPKHRLTRRHPRRYTRRKFGVARETIYLASFAGLPGLPSWCSRR
jgi:hypothetical protein